MNASTAASSATPPTQAGPAHLRRRCGAGPSAAVAGDCHRDQRMAAAVAATTATGPVTVLGSSAAAVSWPSFYDDLEDLWSSR